jgi:transposase
MEVVHRRCAGLDVHKKSVTACVLTPAGKELRSFGATTSELLAMADWLVEQGVTHVAMESAGVYWKPVYNLLEGFEMELLLVNARHMKAVPGRKTRSAHHEGVKARLNFLFLPVRLFMSVESHLQGGSCRA